MTRRRLTTLLAVLALAALASAGCTRAAIGRTQPRAVTVITGSRGLSLDPYSPLLADRRIGRLLFRGLVVVGPDGMPRPDLAEEVPTVANGGIRDGGRTVVYNVRRGVKWHDGEPLTARDVAFTIRMLASGSLVDDPAEDFGTIATVTAIDDRTVRVGFSRPDSVLAWRLAPYVVPEHLLAGSADVARDPYWQKPVGSGPYRVTGSVPGGAVELEPVSGNAPRLTVDPLPTEAAAMRAFDSAEDAVWLDASARPAGADESVSTTYGTAWRRIVFDDRPASAWRDRRLRRALALMTTQTVPADLPASAYPYGLRPPANSRPDTAAALAALEAAGWEMGSGGLLRRSGKNLWVYVGAPPLTPAQGTRFIDGMARQWNSAGVSGGIYGATLPFRPTWAEAGTVVRGERDGYMIVSASGRPYGWAWPFASAGRPSWARPWGLDVAGLADPRADAAYRAARTAPDPATARLRMAEAAAAVYAEYAEIYLEPVPERVLSKGVDGVTAWPTQDEALAQATAWRVKPRSEPRVSR